MFARAANAASRLCQAGCWLVIVGVAAALGVSLVVPAVVGGATYTILSGSMRPVLPEGTMVVVRPTDADRIGVGDIVTYQLRSGEPAVATHRVVTVGMSGTGEPVLRTQGDANDAPDPGWVRPVQVRGRVWYAVPWIGHVRLLTGERRRLAVYAVSAGLLGYAAFMLTGAVRARGQPGRDAVADATAPEPEGAV